MRYAFGTSRKCIATYYLSPESVLDSRIVERVRQWQAAEPWLVYGPRGGRYLADGPVTHLPVVHEAMSARVSAMRYGARYLRPERRQ